MRVMFRFASCADKVQTAMTMAELKRLMAKKATK
jgi:hypothetical protein